jgi:hypothetical protein
MHVVPLTDQTGGLSIDLAHGGVSLHTNNTLSDRQSVGKRSAPRHTASTYKDNSKHGLSSDSTLFETHFASVSTTDEVDNFNNVSIGLHIAPTSREWSDNDPESTDHITTLSQKKSKKSKEKSNPSQNVQTPSQDSRTASRDSRTSSRDSRTSSRDSRTAADRDTGERPNSRDKRDTEMFDSGAYDKMMRVFRQKASVTKENCVYQTDAMLHLPGDVAYGVDKQFEGQARTALRQAHFISLFLQNTGEASK